MTQARLDALVAFGLACVLALWLTPLAARLATRVGLVDHRNSARRLHTSPIPFGGGIAMFVAVAVPVLLLSPSLGGRAHAILLGACVCAAVGLLDDRFEINPIAKFSGELVAAAIPVAAGATIDHLTLPLLHPLDLGALQYPLTMLWIVALMNSFNFIDGMDGLAAGVGAITASTFAILALSLNRGGAAVLAAALAGACLGFLRYNFHPARVFMGDAGSLTLGYLLAVIAIQGVLKTAAAVALLFPTLVLLVPIFDTSFVLLHRIKYGRAPWSADANHLHHRFVRVGFGQRRAALAIYAWCGLLAGCALALRFLPWHTHNDVNVGATLILVGLGICALVATVWIVVVLEVVKQRHLQLFGLARHTDVPADMPVIEAWRRRRAAAGVKR
jgi:UDP-GlcNAc:undecaprenyl-phosphate/decaprenyl-phosphate GlcNAc-1-phosphate transferase